MKVILYLSDMMIPFVVFYIVGIGIIQKIKCMMILLREQKMV